ncbi:MAG: hypothetical protein DDT42_02015 [candidate division WS2 bacterium]|uniref:CRISPR-associated protein Cas4 n=1 Tax=Psychracetigena formicireducens TaxID=2986056 RepID=A0A9E2BIF6_PSYF1|nr:hypothetical protein [Candidatus Psychracetigena formicireducens]
MATRKIKIARYYDWWFDNAVEIVDNVLEIIQKGFYPKATKYKARCVDCCYRNICV